MSENRARPRCSSFGSEACGGKASGRRSAISLLSCVCRFRVATLICVESVVGDAARGGGDGEGVGRCDAMPVSVLSRMFLRLNCREGQRRSK